MGVFRWKRHRAGRSGERIWREKRRQALREGWRLNLASAMLVAFCVFMIFYAEGFGELLMAGVIGAIVAVQVVFWGLGGHVSSLSWMRGVWGEQDTEDVLDKLGVGWVVEHDLDRDRGNWDHVAISRAGVFMIETKTTTARAFVANDSLRIGRRVSYPGASFPAKGRPSSGQLSPPWRNGRAHQRRLTSAGDVTSRACSPAPRPLGTLKRRKPRYAGLSPFGAPRFELGTSSPPDSSREAVRVRGSVRRPAWLSGKAALPTGNGRMAPQAALVAFGPGSGHVQASSNSAA
ncbi:MAG: hypothetical protein K0T00_50 [Gaiellaceae bacterium]|nr:hypothetical protein [Gaiellaceae bacterium]